MNWNDSCLFLISTSKRLLDSPRHTSFVPDMHFIIITVGTKLVPNNCIFTKPVLAFFLQLSAFTYFID
uniref:Uncharacterized protein n=1 Tax=Daphnia magna TaxID=35525 RepID=A0A0P6BX45_9CRUS